MMKEQLKNTTNEENVAVEEQGETSIQTRGCIDISKVTDETFELSYSGDIVITTKENQKKMTVALEKSKSVIEKQKATLAVAKERFAEMKLKLQAHRNRIRKLEKDLTDYEKVLAERDELIAQVERIQSENAELLSMLAVFKKNQQAKLTPELKQYIVNAHAKGRSVREIHTYLKQSVGLDVSYETVRKYIARMDKG